jgi:hypothetical protein
MPWKKTLPNPLGPEPPVLTDALIDWVYFAADRRARTLRLDVEVYQAEGYPTILRREYLVSDSTMPSYTDLTGDGHTAAASELETIIGAYILSRPEFAGAEKV